MIVKKYLGWALVATVILGAAACEKGPTPEEQQKQKTEKASKYWRVVSQLVNPADITDDYQDKTFEPTIGTPAAGDPLTRIVSTNSLQSAVARYNSLTGAGITMETASHSFSDPDVGTLTWTKNADGKAWATVDVNIKQIPQLKTIVYQSPEQGNENGKFDGKSFHRFGDVLKRTSKGVDEYWICVRPCFGPEGKEKSHWVCVNALPEDNIFYYKAKNWQGEFWLPDDLGVNEDHEQNFAELLYAICFPEEWERNVSLYSKEGFWGPEGLPFFGDFHVSNLKLHNQYFWKNVQKAWEEGRIAQQALNLKNGLGELADFLKTDGVTLLRDEYSWWTWWDDDLTLYQATYTNGSSNEELNLHHRETKSIEKNVNGISKIDCRTMGSSLEDYNPFFGDRKIRWVIRHATGAELSENGDHGPQQPISGLGRIYRYYWDVYKVSDLNDKEGPEETQQAQSAWHAAMPGDIIAKNGKLYKNVNEAKVEGGGLAAVIVYVGEKGSVIPGTDYMGLAMGVEDISSQKWMSERSTKKCSVSIWTKGTDPSSILSGIADTKALAAGCGASGHNHPAARFCASYDLIPADVRRSTGLSDWFIPSLGQWVQSMKWAGGAVNISNTGIKNIYATDYNQSLINAGLEDFAFKEFSCYYTSTVYYDEVYENSELTFFVTLATDSFEESANESDTDGKYRPNFFTFTEVTKDQTQDEGHTERPFLLRPFIAF